MSVEISPSKSVMLGQTNISISWFQSAKIKFPQNKGIRNSSDQQIDFGRFAKIEKTDLTEIG